jgi:hypothetical protein
VVGWFVVSVLLSILRARKRFKNIAAEAQKLGFRYQEWSGTDAAHAPRFETQLFQGGWGFGFRNIMTGNYAGLDAQVFDFSRTSGGASQSTSTSQTVAVYKQNVNLPVFLVGPGGLAGKLIDAFEHQNVDLHSSGDFSRHYAVRGPDKDRIRSLFNDRLIAFIERLDSSKQWHIEGARNTLVIYRYNRRVKPMEFRDFLEETSSIAQSFFAFAGTSTPQQSRSAVAE